MAYDGLMEDVRRCVRLEKPTRTPVFPMSEELDVRMCGLTYEACPTDAATPASCVLCAISSGAGVPVLHGLRRKSPQAEEQENAWYGKGFVGSTYTYGSMPDGCRMC
jgi:hypothetical protein